MRSNYLWYQLFRSFITKNGLKFFYKKIRVINRHYVPDDEPVLFIPNHQNSFMDALLVVTRVKHFIYFLTRAQAFRPPLMGKFLRSLNMLPVYRVRDGLSSVTKNNAIFEECVRYLKRNDPILVFAEANHDLKRRIRPLSKGFTRIAFDAEVKTGWNMNLKVIPVGLSYTDHRRSRNDVTVCFGEPIPMDQFKEQYEQDNRAAVKALKEAVSEGMKKTTMHVESLNDYPLVHVVLDDLEPDPKNYLLPDVANANVKKVVEHADESLRDTASRVKEISEKFGLNIKANFAHSANILKAIVLAPLYLFSWLNNRLALIGVNWVIDNKIKDHVFDASIKFILGLTLFPLSWLIVSIPIWVFFGIKWAAIYLLTSAITVIFFKDAQAFLLRSQQRKDLQRFKENHPAEYEEFVSGIRKLNEFRNEVL